MIPFTEFFTGAVYISPSGILHSPQQGIIGSLHFTPGSSYYNAYNGNNSAIHWDLVLIQRKEYGGGEIYFDDILIRKDGMFVLPELQHLNYLSK